MTKYDIIHDIITGDQKKLALEVLKLGGGSFLHCVETVIRILNQAKHIFNENLQKTIKMLP